MFRVKHDSKVVCQRSCLKEFFMIANGSKEELPRLLHNTIYAGEEKKLTEEGKCSCQ